ncbi:hypothetical protein J2S43_002290 [Catenuloplanes nepalensis]|uniref:Uncharacterized protein n=1 Tax=Catenuloplanes nepalensis TaxID=587533 RepID=A0ABT9MQS3_9ACTN|nr:hypothetical protein [Catenuloplanes nepalensis]MDP9793778.1 hypothetical protein [Catenuloplanes nepalensis]
MTGMWLLSAGGESYLVVAVPGGRPGWVRVADVLLLETPAATSAAETPEALLARHPGAAAVARAGPAGVALTHRTGRVAAMAGAGAPAARAVALLHLVTRRSPR